MLADSVHQKMQLSKIHGIHVIVVFVGKLYLLGKKELRLIEHVQMQYIKGENMILLENAVVLLKHMGWKRGKEKVVYPGVRSFHTFCLRLAFSYGLHWKITLIKGVKVNNQWPIYKSGQWRLAFSYGLCWKISLFKGMKVNNQWLIYTSGHQIFHFDGSSSPFSPYESWSHHSGNFDALHPWPFTFSIHPSPFTLFQTPVPTLYWAPRNS